MTYMSHRHHVQQLWCLTFITIRSCTGHRLCYLVKARYQGQEF
jgi:hypothetical protein